MSEWEPAIERILHNFALRLIVPEKYYRQVNDYVNNHNLRGRIVYHRYDGGELLRGFDRRFVEEDSLLNKIDYNPNANYINWLEDRLRSEFDYTCVHSLEDFNHINEKAVTKEGLIKSKGGKHEKDDRPEINRREHYVLGWDNREKIASLKMSMTSCTTSLSTREMSLSILMVKERSWKNLAMLSLFA